MTIEERAIEFQRTFRWTAGADNATNMLVKFATEQQELDNQRVVEWLDENLFQGEIFDDGHYETSYWGTKDELIKEFKQAMKGE